MAFLVEAKHRFDWTSLMDASRGGHFQFSALLNDCKGSKRELALRF